MRIEARSKTAWAWLTATFFSIGHLPGGPGTWAALVTSAVWYGIARAVHPSIGALSIATLIAAVVVILIGIQAAGIVEKESGRQDPGYVVIDEVAGQLVALLLVHPDIGHTVLALALFRVFDIVKPPPVRQLERLHGGLGIMMDDVAAGIYALLLGLVVHHWW